MFPHINQTIIHILKIFVILSKNPLKIPKNEIKNIAILKTIKLDKVIFEK